MTKTENNRIEIPDTASQPVPAENGNKINLEYCLMWRKRDKNSYLRFHCEVINDLKKLENVSQKEIIISGLKQKEFEYFCDNYADKFQIIQILHCNLINDFSPLENLKNLQFLVIDWNNRATKLWNMSNNISLKGLLFEDMTKISSLNGIETAPALSEFFITQDVDRKLYVDTLEPLSQCKYLRKITIRIEGIKDKTVLPIIKMQSLKEADFQAGLFEAEQFAMLVAKLKNVKITPSVPYIIMDKDSMPGSNNVLLIGKYKRSWVSENSPKLKQYEAEWNNFLKKYENPAASLQP
jgi:Leucine-rich repeat (LRR) protein